MTENSTDFGLLVLLWCFQTSRGVRYGVEDDQELTGYHRNQLCITQRDQVLLAQRK